MRVNWDGRVGAGKGGVGEPRFVGFSRPIGILERLRGSRRVDHAVSMSMVAASEEQGCHRAKEGTEAEVKETVRQVAGVRRDVHQASPAT
jgi:hypothetical protein